MDKILFIFFFFALTINNAYSKTEYYLTLRNDKVNLRQGPSLKYPVKLIYKKKFLPVLIIDASYNFRKIIDHENNSGWVHISQLSKKKAALNNEDNSIIFKRPSNYSKPLAILEKGRLCIVRKCKNNWCKIETDDLKGWIEKQNLKGRL
jgi:SH3-like domain-containing protein|tara:strand:+ start:4325 stop:4771 length:447 start_codon:yes stop_codon:yes gene_type:complete